MAVLTGAKGAVNRTSVGIDLVLKDGDSGMVGDGAV
jgi:hypothetical protein